MVSRPTQKSSPAPRKTTISELSPAREQELGQFDRHRVGGGVADLRPVERDLEHRTFAGGENFVRHRLLKDAQVLFRAAAPHSLRAQIELRFPIPLLR